MSQGAALVLLAAAVFALGGGPPGGTFLTFAALAGVSETVGVAALYRGLAVGTMTIVAPVSATAPVVPVVVGATFGEPPTPIQAAGIALAVTGIVLTSRVRPTAKPAAAGAAGVAASVVFGLLAAAGFGGFYVAMDTASEADVVWALFGARFTAVAIVVIAASITRPSLTVRSADFPTLALIGALIVGADAMYALASTRGLLGVVAVLSSLHTLVTIGLARLYLHEHLERPQKVGVALCLCGVLAVSAG